MNKFPIDVVIPWLNPTECWKKEYIKYSENEDPCRIRDLNTIRPTINGILNNMPFVRYIWLIVFDEEQITSANYPELFNDKVRIVYHRDIIPNEFLPNFNSLLPAMYMNRISEISDNIIFMNDDMIINSELSPETYFIDDRPVHHPSLHIGKRANVFNNVWDSIIFNTQMLFNRIINRSDLICDTWHMPAPLSKKTLDYLHQNYGKELYESCKDAKIRRKHSITIVELAYWFEEATSFCIRKPIYSTIRRKFLVLKDSTTKEEILDSLNYHIVCINDSEDLIEDSDRIGREIKEVYLK